MPHEAVWRDSLRRSRDSPGSYAEYRSVPYRLRYGSSLS